MLCDTCSHSGLCINESNIRAQRASPIEFKDKKGGGTVVEITVVHCDRFIADGSSPAEVPEHRTMEIREDSPSASTLMSSIANARLNNAEPSTDDLIRGYNMPQAPTPGVAGRVNPGIPGSSGGPLRVKIPRLTKSAF